MVAPSEPGPPPPAFHHAATLGSSASGHRARTTGGTRLRLPRSTPDRGQAGLRSSARLTSLSRAPCVPFGAANSGSHRARNSRPITDLREIRPGQKVFGLLPHLDSQGQSAGSIPGTRSTKKPQSSGPGLLCCLDHSRDSVPSARPDSPGIGHLVAVPSWIIDTWHHRPVFLISAGPNSLGACPQRCPSFPAPTTAQ